MCCQSQAVGASVLFYYPSRCIVSVLALECRLWSTPVEGISRATKIAP
jgi:hypothetical protein